MEGGGTNLPIYMTTRLDIIRPRYRDFSRSYIWPRHAFDKKIQNEAEQKRFEQLMMNGGEPKSVAPGIIRDGENDTNSSKGSHYSSKDQIHAYGNGDQHGVDDDKEQLYVALPRINNDNTFRNEPIPEQDELTPRTYYPKHGSGDVDTTGSVSPEYEFNQNANDLSSGRTFNVAYSAVSHQPDIAVMTHL